LTSIRKNPYLIHQFAFKQTNLFLILEVCIEIYLLLSSNVLFNSKYVISVGQFQAF